MTKTKAADVLWTVVIPMLEYEFVTILIIILFLVNSK